MAIQAFATRREVNIVSDCAKSVVRFRMIGLNHSEQLFWDKMLASVPCEWHYWRKKKSYGCICRIESRNVADKLGALLEDSPVPSDYGIKVSLVTYRDNDGLRLGPFVTDFYRRIGGAMEFAIESGL